MSTYGCVIVCFAVALYVEPTERKHCLKETLLHIDFGHEMYNYLSLSHLSNLHIYKSFELHQKGLAWERCHPPVLHGESTSTTAVTALSLQRMMNDSSSSSSSSHADNEIDVSEFTTSLEEFIERLEVLYIHLYVDIYSACISVVCVIIGCLKQRMSLMSQYFNWYVNQTVDVMSCSKAGVKPFKEPLLRQQVDQCGFRYAT
jgi:hypothetical protein